MPLPDLLDVTSLSPAPAPAVLDDPVVCAVPGQQYCMVDCTVPNNTIVVQENLFFFTIHCNPSLAYITVSDLQSSKRIASGQSLLLAGNFLYSQ